MIGVMILRMGETESGRSSQTAQTDLDDSNLPEKKRNKVKSKSKTCWRRRK